MGRLEEEGGGSLGGLGEVDIVIKPVIKIQKKYYAVFTNGWRASLVKIQYFLIWGFWA